MFVELHHLVDADDPLPIVVQILPVGGGGGEEVKEGGREEEGRGGMTNFLCSVKSGANLLRTKVCEEGNSMLSMCHPRSLLRVALSCSKSLNLFQTLHLKTFSFST
jgi:hypothetical protein